MTTQTQKHTQDKSITKEENADISQITLGGGCFWCTQACMQAIKGVTKVVSGYAGGLAQTANYDAVCQGNTGHVEVIQVSFNPKQLDLTSLLTLFFAIHDPTTLNRQGNDVGTQYASVIFYHTDTQKETATLVMQQLQSKGINIVTRLEALPSFFEAESYHQDYFTKNPTQGYCNAMIPPKLAKLRQYFSAYIA